MCGIRSGQLARVLTVSIGKDKRHVAQAGVWESISARSSWRAAEQMSRRAYRHRPSLLLSALQAAKPSLQKLACIPYQKAQAMSGWFIRPTGGFIPKSLLAPVESTSDTER